MNQPSPSPGPLLVAIGGFDPTGGAGVVRDFLTARTLNAGIRLIPTAWTEQSPAGVDAIEPRAAGALGTAVREAMRNSARASGAFGSALVPVAVKIGMLPDAAAAGAVLDALVDFAGPVVLDPVLWASSGGALFSGDLAALRELGKRATLVTPNAREASAFSGMPVRDLPEATAAAACLCDRGWRAVLVKGGHLEGGDATDVLVSDGGVREFRAARVPGPSPRGTGCALASAITVGLGRGLSLVESITVAKDWLGAAITGAVPVGGEWHLS